MVAMLYLTDVYVLYSEYNSKMWIVRCWSTAIYWEIEFS